MSKKAPLFALVPLVVAVALPGLTALPQAGVALAASASASAKGKEQPPEASLFAEVMVLHATNAGKGIDERIGKMPELSKPPFSSYDSYELLSKTRLPLVKDDPRTMELPNGRVLRTKLLELLPKGMLRLQASINQPKGKDFLPLLEVKAKLGQSFIVAGQSYKGGMLVLVIRAVK